MANEDLQGEEMEEMEVASQDDYDGLSLPSRDDVIGVVQSLKEAFSEQERDVLDRFIEEGNVDVIYSVGTVDYGDG